MLIFQSGLELKGQTWELEWSDEFDYTGLPDNTKWEFEHGPDWYNGELQYYTNERLENARVENGTLIIEAIHEDYLGKSYTSARLNSKTSWTFGRMEVSARLTEGEGLWPAIWMFPQEEIYGGWPNSGEIDIMEHWSWDDTGIYGTIHTEIYNHVLGTQQDGRITVGDVSSQFHVYAIEWYEDKIEWYVDDNLFFTFTNEGTTEGYPFDHPFKFILNVAVEDYSPGKENTWNKRTMEIDYVRVYSSPTTGSVNDEKTLISNSEHEELTLLNTQWYSYNDNGNGGASTVTPLGGETEEEAFVMTAGGADDSYNASKINFVLDKGTLSQDQSPFVGMGFSTTTDDTGLDLSGSDGVSFYHKGAACEFKVPLEGNIEQYNFYSISVPSHNEWTKVTVLWPNLEQSPYWGVQVPWDASKINKMQWQISGESGSGELWIDEVSVNGLAFTTPLIPTTTNETKSPDKTIFVFPNPAYDILNISGLTSQHKSAEVFNSQGVKVLSSQLSNSEHIALNISKLKDGFYMLHLQQEGDFAETIRFIKK